MTTTTYDSIILDVNDRRHYHEEDNNNDEGQGIFLNFLQTARQQANQQKKQKQKPHASSHSSSSTQRYANCSHPPKQHGTKVKNDEHHQRQSQRKDDDDDEDVLIDHTVSSSSAASSSSTREDSPYQRSFNTKVVTSQKPILHGRPSKRAKTKAQPAPSLPLQQKGTTATATKTRMTTFAKAAPPPPSLLYAAAAPPSTRIQHAYQNGCPSFPQQQQQHHHQQQQAVMHQHAAAARSYWMHQHGYPPPIPFMGSQSGSITGLQHQGPKVEPPTFFLSPAEMMMMTMTKTLPETAAGIIIKPDSMDHSKPFPKKSTAKSSTSIEEEEKEEEEHAESAVVMAPRVMPRRRQVSVLLEPPPCNGTRKRDASTTGKDHDETTWNNGNTTSHIFGTPHFYSHTTITTPNTTTTTTARDVSTPATATFMKNNNHMPLSNAVYFGWIRHSATKTWRDVVKRFSQNRQDYPSWSDNDVYQQIRTVLREKKGIDLYFICQRPCDTTNSTRTSSVTTTTTNATTCTDQHTMTMTTPTTKNNNNYPERKKIFDKNKQYLGTWRPATHQEVLDRTKQRFIDDRKPPPVVVGVKRPRGRPPKVATTGATRQVSMDDAATSAMTTICHTLQAFLVKSQAQLQQSTKSCHPSTTSCGERVAGDDGVVEAEGIQLQQQQQQVDPAQWVTVMQSLEQTQLLIRRRLEMTLEQREYAADAPLVTLDPAKDLENANVVTDESSSSSSTDANNHEEDETSDSSLDPPPSKEGNTLKRKPLFPVLSHHVCLGWNHHPGTANWQTLIKAIADDQETYREWHDTLTELVREKLAKEEHRTRFLVFLDRQGQPCTSIHNGVWFLATEEELIESTKEQFLECRRIQEMESVH